MRISYPSQIVVKPTPFLNELVLWCIPCNKNKIMTSRPAMTQEQHGHTSNVLEVAVDALIFCYTIACPVTALIRLDG